MMWKVSRLYAHKLASGAGKARLLYNDTNQGENRLDFGTSRGQDASGSRFVDVTDIHST